MSDELKKLLETLKNTSTSPSNPMGMSKDEIIAQNEAQFEKAAKNFKKLETKDIVHMLVWAENYLITIQREDPPLSSRHREAVHNARIFMTCILDGKLPENWDDIKPISKD